ncbi:unnamed protein product [Fraxinus pennsylvanica]|uniref:Uncharacterized protein n=1 Tax=Fraxinus pennsylvanica TaxID=56036 RepID=A0AAD1ZE14_9LAMI|nr:unnamed protein product [Fraxinus pennsylvanica]
MELPESIGSLENLVVLILNQCKKLCKLPASFGELKSLYHLFMEETAITELPETFGMLYNLRTLKMAKKPYGQAPQISLISEPATSTKREHRTTPEEHNSISNSTQEDEGQEGNGVHCLEFVFGSLRPLLAKCLLCFEQNAVNSEDFDFRHCYSL